MDQIQTFCPYHKSSNHTLTDCLIFRMKSEDKRRKFLRYHTICFRCCEIPPNNFRKWSKEVKCAICQSTNHCSAQHPDEQRSQGFRRLQFLTAGSCRIHPSKLFRSVQVYPRHQVPGKVLCQDYLDAHLSQRPHRLGH